MDDYLFGDDYNFSLDPGYGGSELAPNNNFFDTDFSSSAWSGGVDYSNIGDYFENSAMAGDGSSSGGSDIWGMVNNALTGIGGSPVMDALYNLGGAALTGMDLYQNNQTNEQLQELLNATLKTNQNNDWRQYTNQAGDMTGAGYNVGMNDQKMNTMYALMQQNGDLLADSIPGLQGGLSSLRNTYEPIFQGYANDDINARNARYAAPYNSAAPFPQQMGIPEGTDPAVVAQYLSSLGVA